MYGKHFASMYTGSLFGKPATVFAVWGYVIAHLRPSRQDKACYVEINPTLVAATFATTPQEILDALGVLCDSDPGSRSPGEDGKRLVLVNATELHAGPMQFLVVNGSKYREMRDEEERRTYLREAKRRERSSESDSSTKLLTVNRGQPPSTQVEVEDRGRRKKEEASVHPRGWTAVADQEFSKLWALCLRKQKKGKARTKYLQLRKAGTIPEIDKLLETYACLQRSEDWSKDGRRYQPLLSSWLNSEGWEDEIPAARKSDRKATSDPTKQENLPAEHLTLTDCARCKGTGWIELDEFNGAPCPECRPRGEA